MMSPTNSKTFHCFKSKLEDFFDL